MTNSGSTNWGQIYTSTVPSTNYVSPSGMSISITQPFLDTEKNGNEKVPGMPPKIYFDLIKSKLSTIDKELLTEKLNKLAALVASAEELGQTALYEELCRKLIITAKEQEMSVCGISHVIPRDIVTKYQNKVKGPKVYLSSLESYSRPIPAEPSIIIKKYKDMNLFDRYEVLYLEYKEKIDVGDKVVEESSVKKTNKEKIKEKDPILFGVMDLDPNKLYYITDWIDEYCDLTLEKFIQTIKKDDPEYKLERIESLTEDNIKSIVQEVKDRAERLKNAKPSNYRDLMTEEEESYTQKTKKRISSIFNKKEKPKK